jgi:hypothetical protein
LTNDAGKITSNKAQLIVNSMYKWYLFMIDY